jgi:beta-phosphoglucomutase-like phosphatase (HAD superfamily)
MRGQTPSHSNPSQLHGQRLRCRAMPMRALIFDFNGTLSDDEHVMEAVARDVLARYGPPPTHEQYIDRLAGLADEAMVRTWLGDRLHHVLIVRERPVEVEDQRPHRHGAAA